LRQRIAEDLWRECNDDGFPVKPQRILCDVRSFMGHDDILLSDVGAHKMWIARYYQCDESNTCLISNGFCSMGFAFPGAIGAKFAHPDRKVLAICGDGGFLMNVQDLETAVRRKINVVAMIWMDGGYGLIEWKQGDHFQGRHADLAFTNPDIELLARSFGAWGRTLSAPDQLMQALDEAFRQEGPALIGVPVDYSENTRLTERLGALQVSI
jgi:acetolactate synthase-1/2/3 large subunit